MLLRLARSNRGNVAMIFAISLIPLLYLTGMGVDYGSAAMREAQIECNRRRRVAFAVTPAMMSQGDAASMTRATNTFNAQAKTLTGVSYGSTNLSVTVADTITTRTVTVTYAATSANFFPSILGQSTIALKGTSQAVGSVAPNINFYLLLDDSPSMAIAATQSGITTMVNNTSSQGGCAFACHETHPSSDNLGNPNGEDNYALAQNLGVTPRIDNLRAAVQNLATARRLPGRHSAPPTRWRSTRSIPVTSVNPSRPAINTISSLTTSLSTVSSDASAITTEIVYDNNCLTSADCNSDEDTDWDDAMNTSNGINGIMPNPGNGTNAPGDTRPRSAFHRH